MAVAQRREASSLADLVLGVTGRSVRACSVYAFALKNVATGSVVTYSGRERTDARPERYVLALAEGGGSTHLGWDRVPRRLRPLWDRGYRFSPEVGLHVLRGVPQSMENATAFALEEVLGEGTSRGGVLALKSTEAVSDCVTLLRLHDSHRCVLCGKEGHLARQCPDPGCTTVEDHDLPLHSQRLRRRLARAEARLVAAAPPPPEVPPLEEGSVAHSLKRAADSVEQIASTTAASAARVARAAAEEEAQPSRAAWESPLAPTVPAEQLRARLGAYRVKLRDVEAELGGVCVDMVAFACAEIYGSHERCKTLMKGAQEASTQHGRRRGLAYDWVTTKLPAHVRARWPGPDTVVAVLRRLTGKQSRAGRLVKRRIRKGNAVQSRGWAMLATDIVSLYAAE